MRSDIKQAWIKALRDGSYPQGSAKLRRTPTELQPETTESWCCLGVLCDVVRPFGWRNHSQYGFTHELADVECNYLANDGLSVTGLTNDQQKALANLNDKPLTFREIADFIAAFVPEEEAA